MPRTKKGDYAAAKKAARTRKKNKRTKKRKKAAKKASRKNILSEKKFAQRLRYQGYFAFRTGKAQGVPDIISYKNGKLIFYEIKPSNPRSSKDALFKPTQSTWIKKYCFKKGVEIKLVYYKGSRPFKYYVEQINKKNISNFTNKQINRDDIKFRTDDFTYK
ncbi:MAG: hypothetical protein IIA83_08045 [Thaumarchaeota archaeon]|nr:hypothetical protein [Nitrososphaerota archaeon]